MFMYFFGLAVFWIPETQGVWILNWSNIEETEELTNRKFE